MNAGTLYRLLLVVTLLTGCSQSPRDALLQMSFPQDKTRTVGDVFAKYPFFKNGHWRDYRDGHNRDVVEYRADVDLGKVRSFIGGNETSLPDVASITITVMFHLHKDVSGFVAANIIYEKTSISHSKPVQIRLYANTPLTKASVADPEFATMAGSMSMSQAYQNGADRADGEFFQYALDQIVLGKIPWIPLGWMHTQPPVKGAETR